MLYIPKKIYIHNFVYKGKQTHLPCHVKHNGHVNHRVFGDTKDKDKKTG